MGTSRPRRVLFRVDASQSIGTGHLVRCVALAAELARRGMELWFAVRPGAIPLLDALDATRRLGHPGRRLRNGRSSPRSAVLSAAKAAGGHSRLSWSITTGSARSGWAGPARLTKRRVVIDDLADRPLPCELLVNPNLGVMPDDYAGLADPATRLLLGTRFVPLRPAFRVAGRLPAAPDVTNVLVTMGGSDTVGATRTAVDAVRVALPAARSRSSSEPSTTGTLFRDRGTNVHRAIGDEAMARLMRSADMAVGAGGTTSWERCALGVPTVIVRVARNQDTSTRRLARAGAAIDAGPLDGIGRHRTGESDPAIGGRRRDTSSDERSGDGISSTAEASSGWRTTSTGCGSAAPRWRTPTCCCGGGTTPPHVPRHWSRRRSPCLPTGAGFGVPLAIQPGCS